MDNTVTVTLKLGAKRWQAFGIQPPARGIILAGKRGKHGMASLGLLNRIALTILNMSAVIGVQKMNITLPADASNPRVTDRAFARLAEIAAITGTARPLRVAVEGGGCSGFQYQIKLDDAAADDLILTGAGQSVLVDQVSLPFLANAVIDFTEELIGARFVVQNPNAAASCGCGISFSI